MFVHLGGETVIDVRGLVAILDVRRLQRTEDARGLLEMARGRHPEGVPARALVVTMRGSYLSPVAAETVARRVERLGQWRRGRTAKT